MEGLLKGYAYDLDKVIRIDGYHGFLLESGAYDWDHEHKKRKFDLGMRRILEIGTEKTYLILIGEEQILALELKEECKVSDILKKLGYKCSIIAEYGGRTGKDGKRHGYYWETWKMALHERKAIFSENGYALQYKGWLDYWFYQFELNLLKSGWGVIDGHDIAAFHFWNVDVDVMDRAELLIEKSLLQEWKISGKELSGLLIDHQLKEEIKFLRMIERDEGGSFHPRFGKNGG